MFALLKTLKCQNHTVCKYVQKKSPFLYGRVHVHTAYILCQFPTLLFVCLFVLFNGVQCHFQQYFSYIVAVSFICGGNRRNPEKTDKLYHIMLYTSPWSRIELTTSVVIDTDCIGSCKSNHGRDGPSYPSVLIIKHYTPSQGKASIFYLIH